MLLVYNIVTRLYYLIIRIASFFSNKAKQTIAGRNGLLEQIKKDFYDSDLKTIWFHCASLGEYEQARPLIEKIKKLQPEYTIVLTFFSPSGYEVRKQNSVADFTYYLPFDTARNAKTFIDTIRPKYAFFIKYDLWYHYLSILKKYQIEHFLISAHFHPNQIYFKPYGIFFKNMLQDFTNIFCQYESGMHLLNKQGISQTIVSGDTRFDRVLTHAQLVKPLPEIERFCDNQFVIILGSSYTHEENILADALADIPMTCKIIIAPHEIHPERIKEIENKFASYETVRYADLNNQHQAQILIIDNVGMLASAYQYGNLSFVGGGFGKKGLHNLLEPLSMGNIVVFGPKNHERFPEAELMIQANLGYCVTNSNQLISIIKTIAGETKNRKELATQFIRKHAGSTDKIYNNIFHQ
jgi:3-deoxy-D-manno-octulosonic-acid transferase